MAYCYRCLYVARSVCLSIGYNRETCKNGRTDRNVIVAVLCASRLCRKRCLKTFATASCSLRQTTKISGLRRKSHFHPTRHRHQGTAQLSSVHCCLQCFYMILIWHWYSFGHTGADRLTRKFFFSEIYCKLA